MLDIIDPMNVGKTFVERNERRKFQRFFYYVLLFEYSNHCQKQGRSHTGAKAGNACFKISLPATKFIKSTLCHFSR